MTKLFQITLFILIGVINTSTLAVEPTNFKTNMNSNTSHGMYFYPYLPYSERFKMVSKRQWEMARSQDAMTALTLMLNGKVGFDRKKALGFAQQIEVTSSQRLIPNFHPETINNFDSKTLPSISINQRIFNDKAIALNTAAKALIEELKKTPSIEEGAILLAKDTNPFTQLGKDKIAVSPQVWPKYQELAEACNACHINFRQFSY